MARRWQDEGMPKRSSNQPKRPTDVNELAASIVAAATAGESDGEKPEPLPEDAAHVAAVALGRLGGLKGGKARAAKLSGKRRAEIAEKAAKARWTAKKR
jgi:hypothetical protein